MAQSTFHARPKAHFMHDYTRSMHVICMKLNILLILLKLPLLSSIDIQLNNRYDTVVSTYSFYISIWYYADTDQMQGDMVGFYLCVFDWRDLIHYHGDINVQHTIVLSVHYGYQLPTSCKHWPNFQWTKLVKFSYGVVYQLCSKIITKHKYVYKCTIRLPFNLYMM